MTSESKAEPTDSTHQASFFSKLGQRRVPQVLGLYMAGSWTLMEFLDSIISRLNISPYWSDIVLMTILIMLPTVIMLAYRHGAPGAQEWGKVEKLGIPLNTLVLVGLVIVLFSGKDLGYRSELIEAQSPDGSIMQVMKPKQEFRKRLYVGFFKINTPELSENMALGVPFALNLDLDQDPYVNAFGPTTNIRPLTEAGFTDYDAPLALLLKSAQDRQLEYLLIGKVSKMPESGYDITITIYQSADGKRVKDLTAQHPTDIFAAIDQLTPQVKMAIGLSDTIIEAQVDLPIEEQLTSNLEAYKAFIDYLTLSVIKGDFQAAEEALQKAIELDQSFAVASSNYATYLFNQTRIDEGIEMLKLANKHNYRLQMSNKFYLTTIGSIFSGEFEKSQSALQQWLTIEEDSVDAWSLKANLHANMGQRELAIEANQKLLELEPYALNRYLTIGQLYASLGDLASAIETYERFLELNPTNPSVHILLGDSYREQGNFELSSQQYTKAQVLFTNDITADRRLSENLKRMGNFIEAENTYLRLLEETSTSLTRYELIRELGQLYLESGRGMQALDLFQQGYELLNEIAPEGRVLLTKMMDSWLYAREGQSERGQAIIDEAKEKIARYDNDMFRANLLIAEAMFTVFNDPATSPIPMIEKAHQSVTQYVGSGNDQTFIMLRGIASYFTDDYEESIKYLKAFLDDYPNVDLGVWLLLGNAYQELEMYAESREVYEGILKEYPAYPDALYNLAQLHVKTDDNETAIPLLSKAISGWSKAEAHYENKKLAQELLASLGQ